MGWHHRHRPGVVSGDRIIASNQTWAYLVIRKSSASACHNWNEGPPTSSSSSSSSSSARTQLQLVEENASIMSVRSLWVCRWEKRPASRTSFASSLIGYCGSASVGPIWGLRTTKTSFTHGWFPSVEKQVGKGPEESDKKRWLYIGDAGICSISIGLRSSGLWPASSSPPPPPLPLPLPLSSSLPSSLLISAAVILFWMPSSG